MKMEVESFVKQCEVCQKAKHELCKYPGLLQPLSIPQHSWTDISMDFVEALPNSHGFSVILVVIDRFIKYGHFILAKHHFSAATIAQLFLDSIIKLYGVPHSIVCDRDKVFTSNLWTELFKLLKTNLKLSSAYHPQTDG
jgi:lipopolysaccharide biosynthesis glycosyltransferase